MNWLTLGVLFSWLTGLAYAANILLVLPIPSYSHQQFYQVYIEELHKRGHNLTVVSPNPIKNPNMTNYRHIDISYGYQYLKENFDVSSESSKKMIIFSEILLIFYWQVVTGLCHLYLSDPKVRELYNSNEKFDLAVLEWSLVTCTHSFQKLSNGKMIGIASFELGGVSQIALGNTANTAYYSDVTLEYSNHMTFLQRLRSTFYGMVTWVYTRLLRRAETNIARQYLGPDVPDVWDLERKVALVFDNSHFTMGYPRPASVNYIQLGGPGFHLNGKRPKGLPKDIKNFVDDAPNGVIYFSLGTNVKTGNMSSRIEKILLNSFAKLKQKVLWKWENENLKVDLKNVKVGKWFPQVDVLAHPNVRGFVTQGGLQSISEAIEFHVPMVVMPFFADQSHNAKKMHEVGVAEVLDFDTITVETLTQTLNKILNDPKYKENVIKFSNLVKDQPMPPLEKAVWWTEYVIRHNGAPHLRSPAATMPWYKYLNLDVLVFILLSITVISYIVYVILKTLLKMVCRTRKSKKE